MDEHNKCISCGSTKNSIVYAYSDLPKYKQIGYPRDIVKCSSCSLVFCHPRNMGESLLDIYENNYWQEYQTQVGEVEIKDRVAEFEMISRERIDNILKYKKGGKFLDVGCSRGFLVKEARDRGFESYGIDLNERDISEGIENYGISLQKSFLKDYENYNFDVIASFNVLEHVSDPLALLEEQKKRLSKDGIIVVGTHDVECKNHREQGQDWKHIIPNEHLYFFSLETLNKLAEKVGLRMLHQHKPIENGIVVYYEKV